MLRPSSPPELADTSAWAHLGKPALAWFQIALENGQIAVCDMVAMEVLYSARDGADFDRTEQALLDCPFYPVEARDWVEARRVFRDLAHKAPLHHRQVKAPDLLIAAVAARNGLTVVHYDSDFDIIASVTAQPVRWAAPRGSL